MATDIHNASEPSLASLVSGIINDAQTLIKQEMALARREFTEEIKQTKQAAVSLALGVGVAALGGLLLLLMLVYLLHEEAGLKVWWSYGIVGGLALIIGLSLLLVAKARASEISLVPPQTAETMKENVQWIKNQT
jgi:hypothetical protein